MFGVSFLEIALVGLVALIIVGPQKLPEMMRTAGEWLGKLRRMTADMRAQTGIDDILREEGIDGVAELRTLLRGERGLANRRGGIRPSTYDSPAMDPDPTLEFPVEGPDARGALPDDLLSDDEDNDDAEPSDAKTDASGPPGSGQPVSHEPVSHEPAPATHPTTQPTPAAPKTKSPAVLPHSHRPPQAPPRAANRAPDKSLPPPPTTPRKIPPRATTHRETPVSKKPQMKPPGPAGAAKE